MELQRECHVVLPAQSTRNHMGHRHWQDENRRSSLCRSSTQALRERLPRAPDLRNLPCTIPRRKSGVYVWTSSTSFTRRLLQANPECQRPQRIHASILGRQLKASETSFVYSNDLAPDLQEACLQDMQTWNPLLRGESKPRDLEQLASSMEMGQRLENQHGEARMDGGHD